MTREESELASSSEEASEAFYQTAPSPEYIDIHDSRVIPYFFRYLIKTLQQLGYIESGIEAPLTNDNGLVFHFEFYVTLSKVSPVEHSGIWNC